MKWVFWTWVFLFRFYSFSFDFDYQQKLYQSIELQSFNCKKLYTIESDLKVNSVTHFPKHDSLLIDLVLRENLKNYYDGYNELISEYINFYQRIPTEHLQLIFSLLDKKNDHNKFSNNQIYQIISLLLASHGQFIPSSQEVADYYLNSIHPTIAINYGLKINQFQDARFELSNQIYFYTNYLHDLRNEEKKESLSLAQIFLGAATINRNTLNNKDTLSYWDIYPFIESDKRDFYPALLAFSYLYFERNKIDLNIPKLHIKSNLVYTEISDTLHFDQISNQLLIENNIFKLWNPIFHQNTVLPGDSILLPIELISTFEMNLPAIYRYNRDVYFPKIIDSCFVFYRTHKGEYFRDLTYWFGPELEEIKTLNNFKTNVLPKNWDVFFKVPCKDSLFFASFDSMNTIEKDNNAVGEKVVIRQIEEINEEKINPNIISENGTTYIIKSGDTLWDIGLKFGVSDKDIMFWNNIDSNIHPGQKIIIYKPQ